MPLQETSCDRCDTQRTITTHEKQPSPPHEQRTVKSSSDHVGQVMPRTSAETGTQTPQERTQHHPTVPRHTPKNAAVASGSSSGEGTACTTSTERITLLTIFTRLRGRNLRRLDNAHVLRSLTAPHPEFQHTTSRQQHASERGHLGAAVEDLSSHPRVLPKQSRTRNILV